EPGEEINPLAGVRQRQMRGWPGPARPDDPDPWFEAGWRRAALETARLGSVPAELLDRLSPQERTVYEDLVSGRLTLAAHLVERERVSEKGPEPPARLGVVGVIDYARCPKRFFWSFVRPLPRFSGPAARIGTEIHSWIERKSAGQATLLELEEEPDLTSEELAGQPGKIRQLRDAFLASRFANSVPLYAERPFLLSFGDVTVSGRIDAISGVPDGPWEVVDYKTGRRPADDELASAQLDVYALACIDVWGKRPDELTLTYLYLGSGEEVSRAAPDPARVRDRVAAWLGGIRAARFDPTPGEQCRWCDFLTFSTRGRPSSRAPGTPEPPDANSRLVGRRRGQPDVGQARAVVLPALDPTRSSTCCRNVRYSPAGSHPPGAASGTNLTASPSSGARESSAARNHSRSPGCSSVGPWVPRLRSAGSSIRTGVGLSSPSRPLGSGARTSSRAWPPSQMATATTCPGSPAR